MAIEGPGAIDDALACEPEHSGGWRAGGFLVSRGMGAAQGKKVARPPLRQGDRGAAVPRSDQAIKRQVGRARLGQLLGHGHREPSRCNLRRRGNTHARPDPGQAIVCPFPEEPLPIQPATAICDGTTDAALLKRSRVRTPGSWVAVRSAASRMAYHDVGAAAQAIIGAEQAQDRLSDSARLPGAGRTPSSA